MNINTIENIYGSNLNDKSKIETIVLVIDKISVICNEILENDFNI